MASNETDDALEDVLSQGGAVLGAIVKQRSCEAETLRARLTDTERQLREAQERTEHLESELSKTQYAYESMKRQRDAHIRAFGRIRERCERLDGLLRDALDSIEWYEREIGRGSACASLKIDIRAALSEPDKGGA